MNSLEILPDISISSEGIVAQKFFDLEIATFHQACHWVKNLPYGFNSDSSNSLIIFEERRGTCTTKHGIIARLARELGLEVYKNLGFYRLNDEIITGVNKIIKPYGLTFIPQIHCFLKYQSSRVDLTEGNCNGKNKTIEDYDFVVRVEPDLSKQEKEACYLTYLQKYYAIAPEVANISTDEILQLLQDCDRILQYRCSFLHNPT
jgi:hypothetical protein